MKQVVHIAAIVVLRLAVRLVPALQQEVAAPIAVAPVRHPAAVDVHRVAPLLAAVLVVVDAHQIVLDIVVRHVRLDALDLAVVDVLPAVLPVAVVDVLPAVRGHAVVDAHRDVQEIVQPIVLRIARPIAQVGVIRVAIPVVLVIVRVDVLAIVTCFALIIAQELVKGHVQVVVTILVMVVATAAAELST